MRVRMRRCPGVLAAANNMVCTNGIHERAEGWHATTMKAATMPACPTAAAERVPVRGPRGAARLDRPTSCWAMDLLTERRPFIDYKEQTDM